MKVQTVRSEYMPGDRCRIREWDDMAREYPVSGPFGSGTTFIHTPGFVFTEGMRRLCGMEFTVSHVTLEPISWEYKIHVYHSEEGVEGVIGSGGLYITAEMLEPIDGPEADFDAPEIEWG